MKDVDIIQDCMKQTIAVMMDETLTIEESKREMDKIGAQAVIRIRQLVQKSEGEG